MGGVTPHPINDVGAKHLGDYLSENPTIFISKCFVLSDHEGGRSIRAINFVVQPRFFYPNASPYLRVGKGEAFLNKAFKLRTKFAARMLRPYKNHDSYLEITKERLIPCRIDKAAII